ncbi:MAG: 5'-methylthioadenosine/adenosylhomocysteine nucleosidase [Muribaculaceae bacterium]|nr:5'-methylthioadenosine/adenosylhomocysteine nucleosidase [Muribaculaceae bacterium]
MKIAIIVAMQKELDLILSQLGDYEVSSAGESKVYTGHEGNNEYIVTTCGIGKVNAALQTQNIIDEFHPDFVINTGVAGGLDPLMAIGSILVADSVAYHDVWCGPSTVVGQADGCPLFFKPSPDGIKLMENIADESDLNIKFGLLCSGDRFISRPEEVSVIKEHFPSAFGCDMESAAIAHTCYRNNVPFMIIRVMSDMPGGGENISEYRSFWSDAPARTFQVVSYLISKL